MNPPEIQAKWDVIVVGAGPAGSSAARMAASAGARTLILERRREVGVPVQCAEYVPKGLAIRLPRDTWAQEIAGMRTFVNGKPVCENPWPGVVLNRDLVDKALAREAQRAGAVLITRCTVLGLRGTGIKVRMDGRALELKAPVIIGADGPLSRTGASMGVRNSSFLFCLQVKARLSEPVAHTEVYFKEDFEAGYAWVFPKGDWANVGLGVRRPKAYKLRALLEGLLGELYSQGRIVEPGPKGLAGGLVPVGGPHERTVLGRVLLAGDAAGQTDPITGGGIANAILCGELAGTIAAEALGKGDLKRLREYEEAWRDILLKPLRRARRHREGLQEGWGRVPLEALVRAHWVAFREYFLEGGGRVGG